jgi:hypothetical protein
MSTIVITWNSAGWNWPDLPRALAQVSAGTATRQSWATGNTKFIEVGSRVFLLRQGPEPRGLMGSGFTVGPVFQAPHWDAVRAASGEQANFVTVDLDVLLEPHPGKLLDQRVFEDGALGAYHWEHRASGQALPDDVADALELAWWDFVGPQKEVSPPVLEPEIGALEGHLRLRMVRHRQREAWLRGAKIAEAQRHGPLRCEVPNCGFDFAVVYGKLGEGFAHVHHLAALGDRSPPTLTRLEDLAVVCPNCHAMIHRGGECRELVDLIPIRST